MNAPIRIALIGDYNPEVPAHVAIPRALELASNGSARAVEATWMATPLFATKSEEQLSPFDAIWCVPNSPYASMEGALCAIRFARESGRPFLGTCGGFQHAFIEYARNALGFHEADHAESNAAATLPLISRLACPLAPGKGAIRLVPDSQLARIYSRTEIAENYHCNFGLNPRLESMLKTEAERDWTDETAKPARGTGGHPFSSQPVSASNRRSGRGHPLIFLRARCGRSG
jgi:CTP synthase (UTP-ammonia lyase)